MKFGKALWRAALALEIIVLLCAAGPLFFGVAHTGVLALWTLAAALGLWLLLARRKALIRCRRLLGGLLAAALLGGIGLSIPMAGQAFFTPPGDGPLTLVVLGAKVSADGKPSLMLAHRLRAAADLMESYPDAVCIVSGGQGEDEPAAEADVMKEALITLGANEDRILTESTSTNTEENLKFTAALIRERALPQRIAIVTDSFHQLRAALRAREEGLEPFSVSAVTPWGLFPSYWVREFFALSSLYAGRLLA